MNAVEFRVTCAIAFGVACSGTAFGNTVYPASGTPLTLGVSYLSGSSSSQSANATLNDLTPNGASSYTYANGWSTKQTAISSSITGSSTTYGFYDDFLFTVNPSNVDSITSTINLSSGASNTHLSNLDVQLFKLTGNASLPAFSLSNMVPDSVGVTNFTLNSNVSGSVVVLDATQPLTAGNYVLQVRGYEDGNSGGSYSGVLDVTPVPLPAGLPLLASGLGLMGLWRSRRSITS